jgi:hypothetical protein
MTINWKNVKPLKDISFIARIEKTWNIKLPESYKEVISDSNAGVPEPNAFDTDQCKGKQFAELMNCNLDDEDSIIKEHQLISEHLPALVLPFAADAGGNYICFDYRNASSEPSVVFWNHEERFEIEDNEIVTTSTETKSELHPIEKVAESFEAFLKKIYPPEFSFDDDDVENAVVF